MVQKMAKRILRFNQLNRLQQIHKSNNPYWKEKKDKKIPEFGDFFDKKRKYLYSSHIYLLTSMFQLPQSPTSGIQFAMVISITLTIIKAIIGFMSGSLAIL